MNFIYTLPPASETLVSAVRACLKRCGRGAGVLGAYPFGSPVSIRRSDVSRIRSSRFWLADKTDGVRVCLVLTRTSDGSAVAALLDRSGNMYGVAVRALATCFDGCVFDAELVATQLPSAEFVPGDVFALMVFDVGMIDGEADIAQAPLSTRLSAIQSCMPAQPVIEAEAQSIATAEGIIFSQHPQLHFLRKIMLPLFGPARATAEEIKTMQSVLSHRTDGFILTSENDGAPRAGTATNVFKVKTLHTLDLLWMRNKLWYANCDDQLPFEELAEAATWDAAPALAALAAVPSNTIVEIGLSLPEQKLVYVAAREDKTAPNQSVCVHGTLASARDSISISDLICAV